MGKLKNDWDSICGEAAKFIADDMSKQELYPPRWTKYDICGAVNIEPKQYNWRKVRIGVADRYNTYLEYHRGLRQYVLGNGHKPGLVIHVATVVRGCIQMMTEEIARAGKSGMTISQLRMELIDEGIAPQQFNALVNALGFPKIALLE